MTRVPSSIRTLSRRQLMTGAAAASALTALGLLDGGPAAAAPQLRRSAASADIAAEAQSDPFAGLRARWLGITTGALSDPADPAFAAALGVLNTTATQALSMLDASPTRTSLFTDLPVGAVSKNVTSSFDRLKSIALAVATPGTSYSGNAATAATVAGGLDFMVAHVYGAAAGDTKAMHGYDNWWDWQIGSPQRLEDTAVMLYGQLSDAQLASYCAAIAYFVADPTVQQSVAGPHPSEGANRLDLCRVAIIRGALAADETGIQQAVAAISPTLEIVDNGNGLHPDYGWIQHYSDGVGVAYTGTYGEVWLKDLAMLLTALAGSPWTITDPNVANVYQAALNGFAPFIYDGVMLDSVRGRAIARATETGSDDGLSAVTDIIMLAAASTDAAVTSRLRSAAKGWLQRSPEPIEQTGSILKIQTAKTLLSDASVQGAAEPAGHRQFPSMDRAVHRRRGWGFSIAMSSDRIAYYENGGGDNLRGWHTGDGMTEVFLDGAAGHYDDQFWPTVDPYRLPGITASLLHLADGQGGTYADAHPDTSWVGGATDGQYAALGQDLHGPFSTLTARKSWFCLDDCIVCIGSAISCTDGTEVDTIVDNRIIAPKTAVRVDGRPLTAAGSVRTAAHWASIDGQSAYVFPGTTALTALRESRTGSWSDISKSGAGLPPVTRDYATLYLNHGQNPEGADYLYMYMPGATSSQAAARARDKNWASILGQSTAVHAVSVKKLGITAANFWQPGEVPNLSATAPVCVLVIEDRRNQEATIVVSDPSRTTTGAQVVWDHPVRKVTNSPAVLTSAQTGRRLVMGFGDLSGLQGAPQVVRVQL